MNTTEREKSVKELLLGKTWTYLNDNFHKFKQAQKIKIALALVQKDMPTEILGAMNHVVLMPTIQKVSGEAPTINLEFNIGAKPDASDSSEDLGYPGETSRLN